MAVNKLDDYELLARVRDGSIMPIQDSKLFTKKAIHSSIKTDFLTTVADESGKVVGYRITEIGLKVLEFAEKGKRED